VRRVLLRLIPRQQGAEWLQLEGLGRAAQREAWGDSPPSFKGSFPSLVSWDFLWGYAKTVTGGVDRHDTIFPIIKIVTETGVETVTDDKLSELFQTQVA
jgi:hypothetical protein